MKGRNPGVLAPPRERQIVKHPGTNRASRRALAAEARGKVRPSTLSFADAMRARMRERAEAKQDAEQHETVDA